MVFLTIFWVILLMVKCLHKHRPVLWRTKYWRHQPVNNHGCCLKNIKLVFEVTINIQSGSKWPLTTNPHFVCNIYKPACLQNRLYFGVLMLASSTWMLGLVVMEQISIGWESTCDLWPDGNPEKYGRPMKSAIAKGCWMLVFLFTLISIVPYRVWLIYILTNQQNGTTLRNDIHFFIPVLK